MDHSEFESLLGAYALDAVDPDEAADIEEHLAGCPRCRAEVESHREVAALLGDVGSRAPAGLWQRIADRLEDEVPSADILAITRSPIRPPRQLRRAVAVGAAAVAVVIALLSFEVVHLEGQLHPSTPGNAAIASAVHSALGEPHETVVLTSASRVESARVVVLADGQAYWVSSNLRTLPADRTYQLWGRTDGRVVSLGLVGSNPAMQTAFRVPANVNLLMVTAEPEGGTVAPTSPVLVRSATL